MTRRRLAPAVSLLCLFFTISLSVGASPDVTPPAPSAEWPGFRGPDMDGLALGARLPDRWSKKDRVRWAVDVPGRGWSSPVVVDRTVFLTSAISSRPFKQPTPGIYGNDFIAEMRAQGLSSAEINKRLRARDNEVPEESDEIRYMVYAFDAATGALKWEREAHKGLPVGGRHRKNTYASETPFTDGERVYVSFGLNIGLFCVHARRRPASGSARGRRSRSTSTSAPGTSPVVHDGRVYLPAGQREGVLPHGARREDRRRRLARAAHGQRLAAHVGLVDAARLEELAAHRDRDDRARLHHELRPGRQGAVAAREDVHAADVAAGGRRRALRRHRRAGRRRGAAVLRDQGRRGRRHYAGRGRDQQRVRALVTSARIGLHAVGAGPPGPRLSRARHRHHAGAVGGHRQGDLQGPRRRRRPHVLGLADRHRRPHLLSR